MTWGTPDGYRIRRVLSRKLMKRSPIRDRGERIADDRLIVRSHAPKAVSQQVTFFFAPVDALSRPKSTQPFVGPRTSSLLARHSRCASLDSAPATRPRAYHAAHPQLAKVS